MHNRPRRLAKQRIPETKISIKKAALIKVADLDSFSRRRADFAGPTDDLYLQKRPSDVGTRSLPYRFRNPAPLLQLSVTFLIEKPI